MDKFKTIFINEKTPRDQVLDAILQGNQIMNMSLDPKYKITEGCGFRDGGKNLFHQNWRWLLK